MNVKEISAKVFKDNLIQRFKVEGNDALENKISAFVKTLSALNSENNPYFLGAILDSITPNTRLSDLMSEDGMPTQTFQNSVKLKKESIDKYYNEVVVPKIFNQSLNVENFQDVPNGI